MIQVQVQRLRPKHLRSSGAVNLVKVTDANAWALLGLLQGYIPAQEPAKWISVPVRTSGEKPEVTVTTKVSDGTGSKMKDTADLIDKLFG